MQQSCNGTPLQSFNELYSCLWHMLPSHTDLRPLLDAALRRVWYHRLPNGDPQRGFCRRSHSHPRLPRICRSGRIFSVTTVFCIFGVPSAFRRIASRCCASTTASPRAYLFVIRDMADGMARMHTKQGVLPPASLSDLDSRIGASLDNMFCGSFGLEVAMVVALRLLVLKMGDYAFTANTYLLTMEDPQDLLAHLTTIRAHTRGTLLGPPIISLILCIFLS